MVLSPAPLIEPDRRFSRIRLSNHLLPEAFTLVWPSGIAPTGDPGTFGVNSVTAISFPSLLQKHDEGIAPSLSQSYVVFEIQTVQYGQLRLPCRPSEIFRVEPLVAQSAPPQTRTSAINAYGSSVSRVR